jgi:integrase
VSKRRANNEGNVYLRADGRYEARLSYTDPATGKRKRASVFGHTQKAALDKLKPVRERLESGRPAKDAKVPVAEWLAQWRTTTLAVSDRKETTRALYATLCAKHLEPAPFGVITLDRLKPTDVEALILTLREKGLSASTIRTTYTVLRAALDVAVRDQLLARNPAALVRRPGIKRHEAKHLADSDVTAVLQAAQASRYHAALVLIASTGLRRGEAAALRWSDVDLDVGEMKVARTVSRVGGQLVFTEPKTARSRRTVPLSPAVVALLKKHRTTQKEDRLRAGNQWRETGLVFTTELGTAVEPRNLLRAIEAAAAKAGVEDIGVHTLRHSAAVGWLEAGVHIKAVADLLGHSSIAITGDVYGHTSNDTARAAVAALDARLGL